MEMGSKLETGCMCLIIAMAINAVLEKGAIGETYNIGGWNEKTNLDTVNVICKSLDEFKPKEDGNSYSTQISFIKDRPGHDRRYAVDASKISKKLFWKPAESFEEGIRKTVMWYINNQDWAQRVQSEEYKDWMKKNYI